jgi:hypothetical protein
MIPVELGSAQRSSAETHMSDRRSAPFRKASLKLAPQKSPRRASARSSTAYAKLANRACTP